MMCMQHVPTIAIVGRPNVGKSAIFNRMAGRRIAIVHDEPGVTRDRLSAPCKITDRACKIMDTGGIGARLSDGRQPSATARPRAQGDRYCTQPPVQPETKM